MNKTNRFLITIFALLALFFTASCEIGLGAAVDMEAPKVEVLSHKDNDSVAQSFSLKGTASDNEGVTLFTIDFEDADLHYKIIPGQSWQKKTYRTQEWTVVNNDANNYCELKDGVWDWSVTVNTEEKINTKEGHTFNFAASAQDARGNSGKTSKVELSLIVDTASPEVSIYKPEIFESYTELKQDVDANKYKLKDGNVISHLLNGTIQLFGRQDQALSFKALRIEFDNGIVEGAKSTLNSNTSVESIEEILKLSDAQIPDAQAPVVYFAKNLTGEDLREWNLTVSPEEWATNASGIQNGLNTGLHIIRIISTSLSSSNAWQRKVLGYFLWYPQADKPWITLAIGDDEEMQYGATECFPGSNISGNIQDDDGITSFVSTIYKKNNNAYQVYSYSDGETVNPKNHALPQTNSGEKPKYSAWTIIAPSENGQYKMVLEVTDSYGTKDTVTKYFKTSDVSAPRIEIDTPLNNTPAIIDSNGTISFKGKITDDGRLESVTMVWLNPVKRDDPNNKITYLNGANPAWEPDWSLADSSGFVEDANKNKLYKFNITPGQKEYTVDQTFNIFSAFGIGQKYELNDQEYEKFLVTQDFIFRATDGITETVKTISLTGDTSAPELSFTKIAINSEEKSLATPPTFPNAANGKQAVIYGTWKDSFCSGIENKTKFLDFEVSWGTGDEKKTVTAQRNSDGTWTATFENAPRAGGTITAKLRDYGGNTKTIQTAARIETSDLGLARIGCLEDEGSYKAGDKLHITLEFTKNTNITLAKDESNNEDIKPTLTLNNGGTATFVENYGAGYGTGSPVHVFEYTIATGEDTDKETNELKKLTVTAINQNGAKWEDTALVLQNNTEDADVTESITISNLPANSNLADSRTIKVDTKAPTITSITPVSANGWYKTNADILLMLEFSEDVKIQNAENIKLRFNHKRTVDGVGNNVTTDSASESGSKFILFEYTVQDGDNANPLNCISIDNGTATVKDLAGNDLASWEKSFTFDNIKIDTAKPSKPSFGTWNPGNVVFSEHGTTFTLTGETDADIEYTINSGAEWIPYTGAVTLENNGTYHVNARQTDAAGNVSDYDSNTDKTFTIDKGDILTRITAETPSGTYSTKTTTKIITGRIEFRKLVTLGKDAEVTLNVKNGDDTTKTVAIKECASAAAEKTVFTFDYEISEGDSINADDRLLDVTGWDLKSPTFKSVDNTTVSLSLPVPDAGNSKRLNENREIKVLTGKPTIGDGKITLTINEETGKPELTIEFDRAVSKYTGSITITQDTTAGNYHVPAVLSVDEYNELASNTTAVDSSTVSAIVTGAYEKGVNGANKLADNTLENDTSTKYILNFNINDTENSTTKLVSAFIAANKHKVVIPVVADEVEISEDKTKMIVDLSSNYKLPVKGASYTVSVPAELVIDEVQEKNDPKTATVTAAGVEKPVIRINKPRYTINNISEDKTIAENTTNATVDMTSAQSASFRIDCRTPDVIIRYSTNETESTQREMNKKGVEPTSGTKTDNPAVSTIMTDSDESLYTLNSPVTLATNKTVASYDSAKGVKVAIAAQASINTDNEDDDDDEFSEISYEFAARTVLKFHIQSYWGNNNDNFNITALNINSKKLKVWVMGGDSPYGGNSNDIFPLSWSDPRNSDANGLSHFMIMQGAFSNNANMRSDWYLVTWDITSPTYHGFAIGTVPSDAMQNGPSEWYIGENCWTSQKSCYILYPGETLLMNTANVDPAYWFRQEKRKER